MLLIVRFVSFIVGVHNLVSVKLLHCYTTHHHSDGFFHSGLELVHGLTVVRKNQTTAEQPFSFYYRPWPTCTSTLKPSAHKNIS